MSSEVGTLGDRIADNETSAASVLVAFDRLTQGLVVDDDPAQFRRLLELEIPR